MESNESSWKLYLIFMALCFVMAIVIYLFYPVSYTPTPFLSIAIIPSPLTPPTPQKTHAFY
jgi:hypothetical protein